MSARQQTLRIAANLRLPIELVVEATAVIGKRGRGKTYTSKRIVEETLRAAVTVAVIDPTDVWWGLRSDAAGGEDGLDVVVIGGKHGDLPLRPGTGKILARLVLEGTSIVLVTKGLPKAERRRIVAEFLTELYDNADGRPILVVIDEADEYAPQGGQSYGGNKRDDPLVASLNAVEDIVRRGRAGGLGSLLITQRVAVLNKNVLEQSDTIIALGVTGKNDIEAVEAWIGKHADNAEAGRDLIRSLPKLARGTAWVWSPEHDVLTCVEVLPISTFDSSRTPKVGEIVVAPRARKSVDLAELGAEMEKFAEQVKADDPAELRKRIADLERQLAARPAAEAERVEVRVLTAEDVDVAERIIKAVQGMATLVTGAAEDWVATTRQIAEHLGRAESKPVIAPRARQSVDVAADTARMVAEQRNREVVARRPKAATPPSAGVDLTDTEALLLATLVQRHPVPMTVRELAVRARRSHTSSTTKTAVSRLRALGLAAGGTTSLIATDAGVAAAGGAEPMPTGAGLLDWWKERLTQAEYDLLVAVAAWGPGGCSDVEATEAAGYSTTSSTPKTALSRIRALGLVTKANGVNVATDEIREAHRG